MFLFTIDFFGIKEELTINNDTLGKAINKLTVSDKVEIISYIDFESDKVNDLKILLTRTLDLLLKKDLELADIVIIHTVLKIGIEKLDKAYVSIKCPECFEITKKEELLMFGGLCEKCNENDT